MHVSAISCPLKVIGRKRKVLVKNSKFIIMKLITVGGA